MSWSFHVEEFEVAVIVILVDFLTITVETFFTINMIRFSSVGLYMIFSGNYSFAANKMTKHHFILREWPVDCCLTPYGQYFRNIMTRTSYIWWDNNDRQVGFHSANLLKQKLTGKTCPSARTYLLDSKPDCHFFRKWPFSGEDDRGMTSPRALVFTRCNIQSERL
jgi:hypothetical protein